MPPPLVAERHLATPDDTRRLAERLAERIAPGDAILLEGGIGAGKTHFARSLIQAAQAAGGGTVEEVPSPTYTLVQTYATPRGEVWHADLFRLSGPDEVIELGLVEAMETSVVLIEWPDRLGDLCPPDTLQLTFTPEGDGRRLIARSASARWDGLWEALANA